MDDVDLLDVGAAGVEADDRGFVETDEYLRTTAGGVWALGDIVGEHLLKHSANHEAEAVARNLLGDELEAVDDGAMPFAVFASPEVAGVGATEGDLESAGREYASRTCRYDETARGDAMHAEGFLKAIIDPEGTILGCHIIGPEASNPVQEVVVAMTAGSGTVRDIRRSIHIHPAALGGRPARLLGAVHPRGRPALSRRARGARARSDRQSISSVAAQ
nr:FAD-dependent oxidoreductase [Natronomonas sp.]